MHADPTFRVYSIGLRNQLFRPLDLAFDRQVERSNNAAQYVSAAAQLLDVSLASQLRNELYIAEGSADLKREQSRLPKDAKCCRRMRTDVGACELLSILSNSVVSILSASRCRSGMRISVGADANTHSVNETETYDIKATCGVTTAGACTKSMEKGHPASWAMLLVLRTIRTDPRVCNGNFKGRRRFLTKPVVRVEPRRQVSSIFTSDGEEDRFAAAKGELIVWWYGHFLNMRPSQSIRYVEVIFRQLRGDVPGAFVSYPVAVGHLGQLRVGSIWREGRCVAEAKTQPWEFSKVNFSEGKWSFTSRKSAGALGLPLPFSDQDYALPRTYGLSGSWMLDLKLSGGRNLLLPCVEVLSRCYGRISEIPRILTTEPWESALSLLYSSTEQDPYKWVVRPAKGIGIDNGVYLAWTLYDEYAQKQSKRIYNSLNTARANDRSRSENGVALQVPMWFQGLHSIECKGLWVNDGRTFLCLEILGIGEPTSPPFVWEQVAYDEHDSGIPSSELIPRRDRFEAEEELDPFRITGTQEPDRNASTARITDAPFRIIGPRCKYTRTKISKPYSEKYLRSGEMPRHRQYSTGDPFSKDKDTGKAIFNSAVVGSGGVLNDLWLALNNLRNEHPSVILGVEWFTEEQGFQTTSPPELQPLPPWDDRDSKATIRWLTHPRNPSGTRGMLILRVTTTTSEIYMLDVQRKKKRVPLRADDQAASDGTANVVMQTNEEKAAGIAIEFPSDGVAMEEIDDICSRIALVRGKFRDLARPRKYQHYVFSHRSSRANRFALESTVVNALMQMGVQIPVHAKDEVSSSTTASEFPGEAESS